MPGVQHWYDYWVGVCRATGPDAHMAVDGLVDQSMDGLAVVDGPVRLAPQGRPVTHVRSSDPLHPHGDRRAVVPDHLIAF